MNVVAVNKKDKIVDLDKEMYPGLELWHFDFLNLFGT